MSEKMIEVERKILQVTLEDIEQRVQKIGAKREFFREKFHAIWVENGLWIRFRIRHEWCEWVREEFKSTDTSWYKGEIGLNIKDSIQETLDFANAIWFQQISETVKLRTQWLLNYKNYEVRIVVDEFESLRWLTNVDPIAEIEVIVPSEQVEEAEKIIFEVGELMWIENERIVKMGENKLFEIFSEKLWEKN